MKTLTKMLILLTLCVATSVSAAEVNKITLSYENGSTVARIDVQGPFQFTHQTEVPKNGKPDRMILDVIGATNSLANSFTDLPACQIKHIRTSQYSVAPEKVVRVVFDLTKPPVYQVASEGNWIKVTFNDKSVTEFAAWTSGAPVSPANAATTKPAPKTVPQPTAAAPTVPATKSVPQMAQTNANIEKDRQSSLNSAATSQTSKPTPSDVKIPVATMTMAAKPATDKPASPSNVAAKPATEQNPTPIAIKLTADQKPAVASIPNTTPTQVTVNKPAVPVEKPASSTVAASTPSVVQKPVALATPTTTTPAKSATEQKPLVATLPTTTPSTKPVVDQKPTVAVTQPTTAPAKPVTEQKPVVVTLPTTTPSTKPVVDQKPTVAVTQPTTAPAKPVTERKPVVVTLPTTTPSTKPVVDQKPTVAVTQPTTAPAKPVTEQKPVVATLPTTPATKPTVDQKPAVASTAATTAPAKPVTEQKPVVANLTSTPVANKPAADQKPATASPATAVPPTSAIAKPAEATVATAMPTESAKPAVSAQTQKPVITMTSGPQPVGNSKVSVPATVLPVTVPTTSSKPAEQPTKPSPNVVPSADNKTAVAATPKDEKKEASAATSATPKDEKKDSSEASQASTSPNQANVPQQVAEVDQPSGQQEDASRPTARFRRSPISANKMKGSLVAEFPQRLVIKYEDLGNRDPFATLVDDSRTNDRPNEQRVPNIEGLKLVGIIVSPAGDNRALFADKAGYSYMMQSGDKVQRGYVLRVESDKVYFQIFEYGWSRTVALTIENVE